MQKFGMKKVWVSDISKEGRNDDRYDARRRRLKLHNSIAVCRTVIWDDRVLVDRKKEREGAKIRVSCCSRDHPLNVKKPPRLFFFSD